MSELADRCAAARASGTKLLSIYLTAGFPDRGATLDLARAIFDAGADFMELGIPFSDPMADGPVIQHASTVALAAGTRLGDVFELCARISALGPVALMGYFNSVLGCGEASFLTAARDAGAQALILPDLLPENEPEFHRQAQAHGVPTIAFVAPTTPLPRMQALDQRGAPFVYAVSVTGVTGSRGELPAEVMNYLATVRVAVRNPLMVGFGVSGGDSARQLAEHADGVIVGSAVIRRIADSANLAEAVNSVAALVGEIKQAISRS